MLMLLLMLLLLILSVAVSLSSCIMCLFVLDVCMAYPLARHTPPAMLTQSGLGNIVLEPTHIPVTVTQAAERASASVLASVPQWQAVTQCSYSSLSRSSTTNCRESLVYPVLCYLDFTGTALCVLVGLPATCQESVYVVTPCQPYQLPPGGTGDGGLFLRHLTKHMVVGN